MEIRHGGEVGMPGVLHRRNPGLAQGEAGAVEDGGAARCAAEGTCGVEIHEKKREARTLGVVELLETCDRDDFGGMVRCARGVYAGKGFLRGERAGGGGL